MYLYTPLSNLPRYPVVTSPDGLVPDLKKATGVGEEEEVVGGGDEADEADDDEDDDDEDDDDEDDDEDDDDEDDEDDDEDDELVWVVLKLPSQQLAALVSQRLLKQSSSVPRE